MGFLALLGIRLGRALASWGLGSAGTGGAPPPAALFGCMHLEVGNTAAMAMDAGDTASLTVEVGNTAKMTFAIEDC